VFLIILATYGICFFLILYFFYDFPLEIRPLIQTIYTFLEYSVFTYILYVSIKQVRFRKFMLLLSVLFVIFQILYLVFSKKGRMDSLSVGVETILIFVYIIIYFQQYFVSSNTSIYKDYSFYLVAGVLIYLGSNFFFNILANQMTNEQWDQYWYLTFIPEIIKNSLFSVSIILFSKQAIAEKKDVNTTVPFLDMI